MKGQTSQRTLFGNELQIQLITQLSQYSLSRSNSDLSVTDCVEDDFKQRLLKSKIAQKIDNLRQILGKVVAYEEIVLSQLTRISDVQKYIRRICVVLTREHMMKQQQYEDAVKLGMARRITPHTQK
ncbi:Hypothetical_protein [Hexamita inflata]|uniref:Hypothetical_protein n=1 Tax=Hexamita inflata TaxID=28002 RepID=A0AA86PEF8_9EUKA|nr:Hypothetical protein HINF_LOCUS24703 [Hexamita inflata]